MKKIQILGTVLMLSVVTLLLVACQKEQDGVTNEVSSSKEETVTGIQISPSAIQGMISQDAASAMAAEYAKHFSNPCNGVKYTQSVTFDVKDIQNFLALIKQKGGKSITVNFGVYDKNTAHNPSQVGRLTVFFTGAAESKGNVRSNNLDGLREFLNEGNLMPQ